MGATKRGRATGRAGAIRRGEMGRRAGGSDGETLTLAPIPTSTPDPTPNPRKTKILWNRKTRERQKRIPLRFGAVPRRRRRRSRRSRRWRIISRICWRDCL
ncbi:hypothetical protein BC936DRAFT_144012 [Jimgerdemannia flammicorona]|uniref:Uncharacterized protein n=1 Tax=Jimgerdemannia flammicorona TaxID=994334 RepID=A0A432ZYP0_9FUNG|nr:hypothetical protein BC936DRAFT_144012 [Jimgerdemannia flammicorona]